MAARQTPSLASLVLADYAALLCFLFPVVFWGLFAAVALGLLQGETGENEAFMSAFFLWSALGATAVCVPLLWHRVGRVLFLLREGVPTPG